MRTAGLLVLLLAQALCAQKLPDIVTGRASPLEEVGRDTRPGPSATGLWGFATGSRNKDDRVEFQRLSVEAGFPIYPGEDVAVFGVPTFEYLRLENRRNTLPPRLITTGLGVGWSVDLDAGPLFRIGGFTRYEYRSDFDRFDFLEGRLTIALGLDFRISSDWTLSAGLFYANDWDNPDVAFFRYFPLPGVNATYRPDDTFSLTLGLPETSLVWRPDPLLQIRAKWFIPTDFSVEISHQPIEEITIREFFGRHEDQYRLTGERWRENSRIFLQGYAAGAVFEFQPIENLVLKALYQFQFATRWKIFQEIERNTYEYLQLQPGHVIGAQIGLRF